MSITILTKENYEEEVLGTDKPVLIDFWATWCGPCQALAPIVDAIAAETETIKICKVNVDDEPELADFFDVMSIPMLAYMKNGKIVKRSVGTRPKQEILHMLEI